MIFFIIILFIAEIIIATTIIVGVLYCDKKITVFNNQILENRYKISVGAQNLRETINEFLLLIKTYKNKIIEKEKKFVLNLIKSSILGLIFMIASKKYKKQVLLVELLMIVHETYKNNLEI